MPTIKKPSDDPDIPKVYTTSTGGSYITTLDAVTSTKGRALIASHNRMWATLRENAEKNTVAVTAKKKTFR